MRLIYLTIILGLISAIFSLPYIFIQVTSQSQGLIRSKSDKTNLTSIVSGQVDEIRIKENFAVAKGDTLLLVDNTGIETKKQSNLDLATDLQRQIEDLDYLLQGGKNIHQIKTSLFQKKYLGYKQEQDAVQIEYRQQKREFDRNESLYKDSVLSEMDFLVFKNKLDNVQARLYKMRSNQQASLQIEKRAIDERIQSITAENLQLADEQNRYYMLAPTSGSIINYDGTQQGGFISAGQTIAQIAPDDSVIVECYVETKNIGFINKGQSVNFQVHAFNYNQWGLATGKVIDIDKNLNVQDAGTPYFRVRCSLDTPYLQLKNGYKGHLKKGITLTARFAIANRSLYQLLFDKVDDWFNPKMETTE
jgi:HlyD family secretion protein